VETSYYIDVPLADELFECVEGPYQSCVVIPSGQKFLYHTYSNTVVGSFADPDVETTLRLAFEEYLRRLRASILGDQKPKLYWRFRKGEHLQLEACKEGRRLLVKLYTRLVVPESPLAICPVCLHTEGERHALTCSNSLVGSEAVA
jgi:hypothetical protein